VQNRLLQPGRAVGIDAAAGSFALLAHYFAAADRAVLGHSKRAAVAALTQHAHDFGDHVAAALHQHSVTDLDAEAADFVFVVQRSPRHGDAADIHRLEKCDGSERSGSADVDVDIVDDGFGLLRGEFERDGPAWSLGGPTERRL